MFLTKYEQSSDSDGEKLYMYWGGKSFISSATESPPICFVSYKCDMVQTYLLVFLSHFPTGIIVYKQMLWQIKKCSLKPKAPKASFLAGCTKDIGEISEGFFLNVSKMLH